MRIVILWWRVSVVGTGQCTRQRDRKNSGRRGDSLEFSFETRNKPCLYRILSVQGKESYAGPYPNIHQLLAGYLASCQIET